MFLPACVTVYHVCAVPINAGRRYQMPWHWNSRQALWKSSPVLLAAEPPLQPRELLSLILAPRSFLHFIHSAGHLEPLCACVCTYSACRNLWRPEKRVLESLKLELQVAAMWVLGTG